MTTHILLYSKEKGGLTDGSHRLGGTSKSFMELGRACLARTTSGKLALPAPCKAPRT